MIQPIARNPGELSAHLASGDLTAFGRSAHALKGASGQIGGARLAALMATLQRAGEDADRATAAAGVPLANEGHAALVEAVEACFRAHPEWERWTGDDDDE
jgi:HPt (histidine-containing phosphotransfer) domain-containing protein